MHGASTRKVDDLVRALSLEGISKSEVSRICADLDTGVAAFRTRPLTGEHRYLWVDATCHKVRVDGRPISQATVVAVAVTSEATGRCSGSMWARPRIAPSGRPFCSPAGPPSFVTNCSEYLQHRSLGRILAVAALAPRDAEPTAKADAARLSLPSDAAPDASREMSDCENVAGSS